MVSGLGAEIVAMVEIKIADLAGTGGWEQGPNRDGGGKTLNQEPRSETSSLVTRANALKISFSF